LSNDTLGSGGGTLSITSVSPTNGTASIVGGTNVLFTPTAFFTGTATIGYSISDGLSGTASSLITVTVSAPPQPHITSLTLSGTTLIINGTNGTAGLQYTVLSSTNLAAPLNSWAPVSTNTFSAGNFSVTNTVTSGQPKSFFTLRLP
jgi:hypothetical protein